MNIKQTIKDYKPLFHACILIFIMSIIFYLISLKYTHLKDILGASSTTPWGIITSLFIHTGFEHLKNNMIGLFLIMLIFIITNISLTDEERKRRTRLMLFVIFSAAILSNLLWIIIFQNQNSIGESGINYAALGSILGFTLINSLILIISLIKSQTNITITSLTIGIYNVLTFFSLLLNYVFYPESLIGIPSNVNTFIHIVAFFLGYLLTTIGYLFCHHFRKNSNTSNFYNFKQ